MKLVTDNVAEMVPQPTVVETLEKALAEARRGEIDGVVLLISHSDGTTSDRWGQGKGFWWIRMVGCAEVWKKRYIERYAEVEP